MKDVESHRPNVYLGTSGARPVSDVYERSTSFGSAPPMRKYSISSPGRVKLIFDTTSEPASKETFPLEFTNTPHPPLVRKKGTHL